MKKLIIFSVFCLLLSIFCVSSYANVVLKLIAANPSRSQTQKAAMKAYLPKETKPEDIIDKEDLDIAYDTQQGSYFVAKEYDLKPGEVLEKTIELRDIWVIPNTEIESLRSEAIKMEETLKGTEYAERVKFLKNSVDSKLKQIIDYQNSPPANPERHISDYRDNLKTLEEAKADMALARSLMAQVKSFPTVTIWRLIMAIIIFLGLLGISFYIIWHRQIKAITQDTFPGAKEASAVGGANPSHHDAQKEKKMDAGDIEKIIKGEG